MHCSPAVSGEKCPGLTNPAGAHMQVRQGVGYLHYIYIKTAKLNVKNHLRAKHFLHVWSLIYTVNISIVNKVAKPKNIFKAIVSDRKKLVSVPALQIRSISIIPTNQIFLMKFLKYFLLSMLPSTFLTIQEVVLAVWILPFLKQTESRHKVWYSFVSHSELLPTAAVHFHLLQCNADLMKAQVFVYSSGRTPAEAANVRN